MLGGGVQIGQMTEFCGVPGIGKTQMAIQLALDVQIPESFSGVEGEVVYIDTEGSFVIERVVEMAEALLSKLTSIHNSSSPPQHHKQREGEGGQYEESKSSNEDSSEEVVEDRHRKRGEDLTRLSVESLLSNIHVYRVFDHIEQIAAIRTLPQFIQSRGFSLFLFIHKFYLIVGGKVKLVIIDSIAFHFRHDFQDASNRSRTLSSLANQLNSLANGHDLAVVLINQMTTRISRDISSSSSSDSRLAPALGESWSHAVTHRILLTWSNNSVINDQFGDVRSKRCAKLIKSSSRPCVTVLYEINRDGVRDVINSHPHLPSSNSLPQKRPFQFQFQSNQSTSTTTMEEEEEEEEDSLNGSKQQVMFEFVSQSQSDFNIEPLQSNQDSQTAISSLTSSSSSSHQISSSNHHHQQQQDQFTTTESNGEPPTNKQRIMN